jgi:hypothetical protein
MEDGAVCDRYVLRRNVGLWLIPPKKVGQGGIEL